MSHIGMALQLVGNVLDLVAQSSRYSTSVSNNAAAKAAKAAKEALPPSMRFVDHVTIPDRSAVTAGAVLTKTWRVKNDAPVEWPASTKLIFVRGDEFRNAEGEEFVVAERAAPGQEINVSAELRAPNEPGRYSAFFRLADANQAWFGDRLYVDVFVIAAPVDEVAAAASSSASSSAASTDDASTTGETSDESAHTAAPTYADMAAAGTATAVAAAAVSSVEGAPHSVAPSAPEAEGSTNPSAPELEGEASLSAPEGEVSGEEGVEGQVRETAPGGPQ